MGPEQELSDKIKAEYPSLVIEVSGPWRPANVWISNFRDQDNSDEYIHYGSTGATMLEALERGYEAVVEWAAKRSGPAPR